MVLSINYMWCVYGVKNDEFLGLGVTIINFSKNLKINFLLLIDFFQIFRDNKCVSNVFLAKNKQCTSSLLHALF